MIRRGGTFARLEDAHDRLTAAHERLVWASRGPYSNILAGAHDEWLTAYRELGEAHLELTRTMRSAGPDR